MTLTRIAGDESFNTYIQDEVRDRGFPVQNSKTNYVGILRSHLLLRGVRGGRADDAVVNILGDLLPENLLNKFNPEKGLPFETWYRHLVKRRVESWVRTNVLHPKRQFGDMQSIQPGRPAEGEMSVGVSEELLPGATPGRSSLEVLEDKQEATDYFAEFKQFLASRPLGGYLTLFFDLLVEGRRRSEFPKILSEHRVEFPGGGYGEWTSGNVSALWTAFNEALALFGSKSPQFGKLLDQHKQRELEDAKKRNQPRIVRVMYLGPNGREERELRIVRQGQHMSRVRWEKDGDSGVTFKVPVDQLKMGEVRERDIVRDRG